MEIHEFSRHLHEKYRLLQEKTSQDPVFQKLKILQTKWPTRFSDLSSDLRPFWNYCEELYMIDDIIFKCNRIVTPADMRSYILELLHVSHMGIDKTRVRAQRLVFWSNIFQCRVVNIATKALNDSVHVTEQCK